MRWVVFFFTAPLAADVPLVGRRCRSHRFNAPWAKSQSRRDFEVWFGIPNSSGDAYDAQAVVPRVLVYAYMPWDMRSPIG